MRRCALGCRPWCGARGRHRARAKVWNRHCSGPAACTMADASGQANRLIEVNLFAPLVCVDAPLYAVEMADNGEIVEISPRPLLLSALRLPKWPGKYRPYLARAMPEALITVMTVDALGDVLDRIAEWCQAVGECL